MKKIILALTAIAISCIAALVFTLTSAPDPKKAHGMVDIRQSALSFERAGKIKELLFDEGDCVKKGQVMAILDTDDLDHQIAIQRAKSNEAKAYYKQLENGYRPEEITQAKEAAQALFQSYSLAELTFLRNEKLYKSRSISIQQLDESRLTKEKLYANLKEAKAKVSLLEKGFRDEEILRAELSYEGSVNTLSYLEYQKNTQSVIKAPFDGIVRARHSEIGETVTSQSTVFELSMLDLKRVRVYATEEQLSFIRVGQKARIITVDSSVEGKVAFISQTAMFTPKTVQTEQIRAELVYEVRIDTKDENGILRYGQSVSVEFE
ncbi:MAG: HlyD family efflux transporter periplasmic adaptor subunit [Succinivibrio sp.]